MEYTPILIEEFIKRRPKEIPTAEDLNNLCNRIIEQHNNSYNAITDLGPKYQDCIAAYNALTIVIQRRVDGLTAGVMPDGSVTYIKLDAATKAEMDLIVSQITALDLLADSINTLFTKLNNIEAINRIDIGGLI